MAKLPVNLRLHAIYWSHNCDEPHHSGIVESKIILLSLLLKKSNIVGLVTYQLLGQGPNRRMSAGMWSSMCQFTVKAAAPRTPLTLTTKSCTNSSKRSTPSSLIHLAKTKVLLRFIAVRLPQIVTMKSWSTKLRKWFMIIIHATVPVIQCSPQL